MLYSALTLYIDALYAYNNAVRVTHDTRLTRDMDVARTSLTHLRSDRRKGRLPMEGLDRLSFENMANALATGSPLLAGDFALAAGGSMLDVDFIRYMDGNRVHATSLPGALSLLCRREEVEWVAAPFWWPGFLARLGALVGDGTFYPSTAGWREAMLGTAEPNAWALLGAPDSRAFAQQWTEEALRSHRMLEKAIRFGDRHLVGGAAFCDHMSKGPVHIAERMTDADWREAFLHIRKFFEPADIAPPPPAEVVLFRLLETNISPADRAPLGQGGFRQGLQRLVYRSEGYKFSWAGNPVALHPKALVTCGAGRVRAGLSLWNA